MKNNLFRFLNERLLTPEDPTLPVASVTIGGELIPLVPAQGKRRACKGGEGFSKQEYVFTCGVLELVLSCKTFADFAAREWQLSVTNTGTENSPQVSGISPLHLNFPAESPVVWKGIKGDSNSPESFAPFEKALGDGDVYEVQPHGGKSSHHSFPFFDLCDETSGTIIAIGWTGQWCYRLTCADGAVTVQAGLPDADFYVRPQETFQLPSVLLFAFSGCEIEAHNEFRRLILMGYTPYLENERKLKLPIACQTFDRYSYTLPVWNTEKGQKKMIDLASRCKYFDTYWIDAAWFEGGFPNGVGNYQFREGFPNGLGPVGDYAHQQDLRFVVWFEPERVDAGTQLELEHPEWLLTDMEKRDFGFSCVGKLFNFAEPEAAAYMTGLIGDRIAESHLDIYRHDFNIYPLGIWKSNDIPGRAGVTEIRYIAGLYKFWDDLRTRFPGLVIDNCSSGGNRMDIAASSRTVYLWRSDTGCRAESSGGALNQNQSLSLSKYIPFHSLATWSMNTYDCRSVMTNGFAPNFPMFDDNFNFNTAVSILAECKHFRDYWLCDFYPLSDFTEDLSAWAGWNFHDRESGSGMAMLFRRDESPDAAQVFSFPAAKAEQNYELRLTDENYRTTKQIVRGSELKSGVAFTIEKPHESIAVEYIPV